MHTAVQQSYTSDPDRRTFCSNSETFPLTASNKWTITNVSLRYSIHTTVRYYTILQKPLLNGKFRSNSKIIGFDI